MTMYDLTMYDWDYSSYHKCLHRRGYLAVLTPIVHRQIVNNFIPRIFALVAVVAARTCRVLKVEAMAIVKFSIRKNMMM